jgi:hypothetical protein
MVWVVTLPSVPVDSMNRAAASSSGNSEINTAANYEQQKSQLVLFHHPSSGLLHVRGRLFGFVRLEQVLSEGHSKRRFNVWMERELAYGASLYAGIVNQMRSEF